MGQENLSGDFFCGAKIARRLIVLIRGKQRAAYLFGTWRCKSFI